MRPEEVQELNPCIWQHPGTPPLCPQHRDNAQDWGLRGKNPWEGLGACAALCEALAFAKQPQFVQNQLPALPSLLSQGGSGCSAVLPLSRLCREFLWRCLSHSRELCNLTTLIFPAASVCVCVCETHEINSGDSPLLVIPDIPSDGNWAPLWVLQDLIHREHLAGQVLMIM